MKRFSLVLGLVVLSIATQAGGASAMQVGAYANGSTYVVAARGTIYRPSEFDNLAHARVFWLGITFPDGVFFQSGWVDASNTWGSDSCQTGFGTFTTALANGQSLFPDLYNLANCNLTGSERTFKVAEVAHTSDYTEWQFYMSSNPLGPALYLSSSDSHFLRNNTDTISELVDTNTPNDTDPFATVEYSPAIQFLDSGSSTWGDAANGDFYASSDRSCAFALKLIGDNDFKTGKKDALNPASCHTNGDQLW